MSWLSAAMLRILVIALAATVVMASGGVMPPPLQHTSPTSTQRAVAIAASRVGLVRPAPFASFPGAGSFGTYMRMTATGGPAFALGVQGVESMANVPSLTNWTIESWIWDVSGTCDSGSASAWGVLSGSLPQPNTSVPVAGIDGGATWVWPGGSAGLASTCGSPNIAGPGSSPHHFALDYDGQNVRAFLDGALAPGFPVPTTSAAIAAAAPAGILNAYDWSNARFDEFRISNSARYLAPFTVASDAFATDINTVLLWHMDGGLGRAYSRAVGNRTPLDTVPNFLTDATGSFNGQLVTWGFGGDGFEALIENFYFQGQNPAAVELGNLDEYCATCQIGDPVIGATGEFRDTVNDLNIPGRGYNLRFDRTYSSFASAQDGPIGFGWTDNFNTFLTVDGSGNVTVHEENGSQTAFTKNGTTYQPPGRVLASLTLVAGVYAYTRRDLSQLKFDATLLRLTSELDRNGYVTTLAYTGSQLTTVTDQAGRHLTFTYWTGNNHIKQITDPAARSVSFNYTNADGTGDLTSVIDLAANTSSYTYGSGGLSHDVTVLKDAKCVAAGGSCPGLVNAYDGAAPARVHTQSDALNQVTTFDYNQCAIDPGTGIADGPCTNTKVTHPAGDVDMEVYIDNLPVAVIRAYGTSLAARTSYRYDVSTLALSATTDPNGHTRSQTWDTNGNLLTKTDPLQRTTTFSQYNSFNEPQQVQDPAAVVTTNVYDAHGNLTQTSTPLTWNNTTQTVSVLFGYTDATHTGDMTQMTDQDGKVWHFTYDTNGNRITTTDPLSDLTKYFFDSVGRPTCMITPLGSSATSCTATGAKHVWKYTTNAFGDPLSVKDPLADLTQYQYDPNRNRSQLTDANGNISKFTYDFNNELTAQEDGFGTASDRTLQTVYDSDSRLQKQIDGLSHPPTVYGYDSLSRLNTVTDPLNRVTTYTYDLAGNRRSLQSFAGAPLTGYCYDAANQLTGITYSNALCGGTMDVSYAYFSDGLRQTMVDSTGTSTYAYDTLKRLRQMTSGGAQEVDYDYNLRGLLTQLTYPSTAPRNHIVTRAYDDAGRMTSVAVSTAWVPGAAANTFKYDADSNLCLVTYGNGVVGKRVYDAADRLSAGTATAAMIYGTGGATTCSQTPTGSLLSLKYPRDPNGQITAENTTGYAYDNINRLKTAGATSYTVDAADELKTQPFPAGATTTLTYDAANQLATGSVSTGASYTYNFDSAGNRRSRVDGAGATLTYNYDQLNRLTTFVPAGPTPPTYGYTYNGDGLRMAKTTNGSTTASFAWDVAEGLPLLLNDGSTNYITGPAGLPVEQVTSAGALYFYQADQLGSTRIITNASKVSVNTYAYDPYGNVTASTGTLTNPFQFAGQYADPESGLFYLRARYYDPNTGQFVTRDAISAITRDRYTYAADNPVNKTDPSGNCTIGSTRISVGSNSSCKKNIDNALGFNPDYYHVGCTFGFGINVSVAVQLTDDRLFVSPGYGVGVGLPAAPYFGLGKLNENGPSQKEIDDYVSSYTLSAGGAFGAGGNVVWGNEGQWNGNAVGAELIGGLPSASLIQSYGFQVAG